jgi:phage major head subunit gpT-like protein
MPTVLRFGALRVVIYPNDHRPAHVHVIGGDDEAVFNLNCSVGAVTLRENYGFALRDVTKIEATLNENVAALCEAWRSIHGIG